MRTFRYPLLLCSLVIAGSAFCTQVCPTAAQDRGRDESRDRSDRGDRGGDRGSDRGRGGFDPSEWYKRMDANGDGIIQPSEMSDRTRSFLERSKPPGIDLSQPIPISKLVDAFNAARANEERSRSESGSSGSSGGSSSGSGGGAAAPAGIQGFGGTPTKSGPPGFNVPLSSSSRGGGSIEQRYSRQVIEYVDRMLADYDRNRDGILDANEISQGRWQNDPRESDLNKDGKLDKNELLERIAKRLGNSGGGSSSSGGSSGSSSGGASSADEREKFKKYAESLVKQHDNNKNGVLDRDEWSNVKSITKETDLNNDSVVTIEELTVKLTNDAKQAAAPSGGGSSSSSSSSGSGRGGPPSYGSRSSRSGSGGDGKNAEVRSYRQKSPLERLPKGLPDWFARNDADGDGQIVMAEYSTSWSESKATEFAKFDLNGDGVVTPVECLKAQELEKSSSSSSSSSSTSSSSGGGFGRR